MSPPGSDEDAMCAAPFSVQPVPWKLLTVWPGTSVYQLLSRSDRNGWVNCGVEQADVSTDA